MEQTSCIVCGAKDAEPWITVADRFDGEDPERFTLVRCRCGMVYLNPRPDENEIAPYYENEAYQPHRQTAETAMDFAYRAVQAWALRVKAWRIAPLASKGNLLDVGGGQGEFGEFMARRGWNVVLQDREKGALAAARQKGLDVVSSLSELRVQERKFDLITLWHALEHIHDVEGLMADLSGLVAPGGAVVIAVPNLNAPEREGFGGNWAPWDAPRHLYHFSRSSLTSLMDRYGWRTEKIWPLAWDTPYNVLLSLGPLSLGKAVRAALLTLRTWIVTAVNPMERGSSMMVMFRRKETDHDF